MFAVQKRLPSRARVSGWCTPCGLEAEVIQVERDLRLPAAPQVRDPERLYGVFDCPVQPAEVAVAPDRGESENHRELLDQRSRTAVPAEPVEGAARDEVSAIHEP